MQDEELIRAAQTTVRAVAAAAKTLRLYPPTSPMPRQAAEAAIPALAKYLESESSLVLSVVRNGFTILGGQPLASGVGGGGDLADMLRSHGVAEVVMGQGTNADELIAFLQVIMQSPEEVREAGGIVAALAQAGCVTCRVVTVSLAVTQEPDEVLEMGEDVDEFFRELASDPKKLATWLAAASKGDPANLSEGIQELAAAAGPEGMQAFLDSFASAFVSQDIDARDVIMGLGFEENPTRDLLADVFSRVTPGDMSDSLVGGVYGKNMLSLSNALTKLPLGAELQSIIADVKASLPTLGHESREVEFLDHMLDIRVSPDPERPLVEVDPAYGEVARATELDPESVAAAKGEAARAGDSIHEKGVVTMLALLDQQEDFDLYVKSLDALAATVPRLLASGELELAANVLGQIADRESRTSQPWPELTQRLRAALKNALPAEAMGSLLDSLLADPGSELNARAILRHADESAQVAFAQQAIARRDDAALDALERLLGRRSIDLLASASANAQWSQLGPVVRRLAAQTEPSAARALEALARRPDEQSRAEVAEGLSGTTNPAAGRLLAEMLKDPSAKVMATAALAHMKDASAQAALKRLAERKALIKRGHFAEIQQLANEALRVQAGLGGSR